MAMTFSASTHVTLWVPAWTTHNAASYLASLVFLALLGCGQEYLLAARAAPAGRVPSPGKATALYTLNALTSYLLMLAVMTYNIGVLLAVLTGMCVGRFATSSRAAARRGAAIAETDAPEAPLLTGAEAAATADICCPPHDPR